jgi:hypothetical protein
LLDFLHLSFFQPSKTLTIILQTSFFSYSRLTFFT